MRSLPELEPEPIGLWWALAAICWIGIVGGGILGLQSCGAAAVSSLSPSRSQSGAAAWVLRRVGTMSLPGGRIVIPARRTSLESSL